jgi:hypothetical protein
MIDRRPVPSVELLRECFDYDPDTGVIRWNTRPQKHFATPDACKMWNTKYAGKAAGGVSHVYLQIKINHRSHTLHRIIWKMMTGKEPPTTIDHIDGNPANNCWSNLRAATPTEQKWNTGLSKKNVSGFKGVSRYGSRWRACININGVKRHRGCFDTPEEAAVAYETAARELHGEFYYQGKI